MTRPNWESVEVILQAALDRPAPDRPAYLNAACAGDTALRNEVDALLRQIEADPAFMDTPLVTLPADESRDSADATARSVAAEERIGPYRIVRELGAGGMGIVLLAMHEGPGFERPVALKVIRKGMDTADLLRRFQLERRMLAALRHPNVARLLDAGATEDGRPYFVMDFVEGERIDTYCERQQLSVPQRLSLFLTVCDAVQHAHGNLIVHRDLKPGNILVGTGGVPVLLDFGIGKLMDPFDASADASATRTGARAFTPEAAAPEQIRGEPVSIATDVHGLGVLLYRLLTGQRPFAGDSAAAIEQAVLESEPPQPSSVGGRELAGDLDTIVLKAMRKEPERRYATVAALADDIRRHLDGRPVLARPDTFGYRAGKFLRRHRLPIGATGVVFASLVGATLYSREQTRAVTRERDKALEVQMFLLETFGARGGSDTVSVRRLVDAQAALVPISYADRPELHAQMLAVLADAYDRMGRAAQAEPLARDALAIRRRALRSDHPDIASSVSLLGWIQHARGRSDSGEALLREAVALWDHARPINLLQFSRTLNDLGVVRESRGAYAEADTLYRRALAIRRALPGRNDWVIALTSSNLSVVMLRQGNIRGAVAEAESALTTMRRAVGPDHQRAMLIQSNLAAMRGQLGDLPGAEAAYRDVVDRMTLVLGREHPNTAVAMFGLAANLRSQGRLAAAESLLAETLALYQKIYGAEHARVALSLVMLGSVRTGLRRYAEARPLIERALAMQRKLLGETHRDVAQTLGALGTLHAESGNMAEAERRYRQAMDVYERALGKQHVEVANARARLARVVLRRGRPEQAYGLFQSAHEVLTAAGVNPASASMRDLNLRSAQALVALGRLAAADSVLRRVPDSGSTAAQRGLADSLRARIRP